MSRAAEQGESWAAAWVSGWDRFWFTPSDPLLLAVLRIAAGGLLAWSSLVWLLDAEGFFGTTAWQAPGNVWRMNDQPWHWSWYFAAGGSGNVTLLVMVSLERAWFNCHTSRLSYSSRHRSIASGLNPFVVALKFVRGQKCVTTDDAGAQL